MGDLTASADARDAYDELAPFYDTYTAHHDYELWTAVIRRLGAAHGLRGTRMLDLGCGTGKSFLPFARDGWSVTACDFSPRMLELAAAKAPDGVELHLADIRALPRYGTFDLVLLLDDVVNYLTEPDELVRTFAGARENLDRDGVMVFDVNTLLAFRTAFSETHVVETDGMFMAWRGSTPADAAPGVLAEAVLDAFLVDPDGRWERHVSVHRQRHHIEDSIRTALAAAGLECAGVYGHGPDGRPDVGLEDLRHTKGLFIARHGAPGARRR